MDWTSIAFINTDLYHQYKLHSNIPRSQAHYFATKARHQARKIKADLTKVSNGIENRAMKASSSPSRFLRALKISTRLSLGIAGVVSGGWLTTKGQEPLTEFFAKSSGLSAVGLSGYYGIAVGVNTIDKSHNLTRLVDECAEKHRESKKRFIVESLEYPIARRAVAGAELIANSDWGDLSHAIEIADDVLRYLPNIPEKQQRAVARKISEIVDSVDIHHPHHGVLQSMETKADPSSRSLR